MYDVKDIDDGEGLMVDMKDQRAWRFYRMVDEQIQSTVAGTVRPPVDAMTMSMMMTVLMTLFRSDDFILLPTQQ